MIDVRQLRSNPERLKQLFFTLPLGARERLRQNPAVADFLPPESENPGGTATVASVTDVRLVLSQPLRPLLLLASPRRDAVGEARVLEPGGTVIPDQNVWGLMVRTRQELLHSRGYDVTVRQNGMQQLFRSGDVLINTGLDRPVVLHDVPSAALVQSALHELMERGAGRRIVG